MAMAFASTRTAGTSEEREDGRDRHRRHAELPGDDGPRPASRAHADRHADEEGDHPDRRRLPCDRRPDLAADEAQRLEDRELRRRRRTGRRARGRAPPRRQRGRARRAAPAGGASRGSRASWWAGAAPAGRAGARSRAAPLRAAVRGDQQLGLEEDRVRHDLLQPGEGDRRALAEPHPPALGHDPRPTTRIGPPARPASPRPVADPQAERLERPPGEHHSSFSRGARPVEPPSAAAALQLVVGDHADAPTVREEPRSGADATPAPALDGGPQRRPRRASGHQAGDRTGLVVPGLAVEGGVASSRPRVAATTRATAANPTARTAPTIVPRAARAIRPPPAAPAEAPASGRRAPTRHAASAAARAAATGPARSAAATIAAAPSASVSRVERDAGLGLEASRATQRRQGRRAIAVTTATRAGPRRRARASHAEPPKLASPHADREQRGRRPSRARPGLAPGQEDQRPARANAPATRNARAWRWTGAGPSPPPRGRLNPKSPAPAIRSTGARKGLVGLAAPQLIFRIASNAPSPGPPWAR